MSDARNAVASATGPLFEMGVRAERERIIALFETMNCHGDTSIQCDCGSYWEAIALIKGENA